VLTPQDLLVAAGTERDSRASNRVTGKSFEVLAGVDVDRMTPGLSAATAATSSGCPRTSARAPDISLECLDIAPELAGEHHGGWRRPSKLSAAAGSPDAAWVSRSRSTTSAVMSGWSPRMTQPERR